MSLRIDSSGLRRRMKWMPKSMDDAKGSLYLEVKPDTTPKLHCILYIVLWFASLLGALFYFQHKLYRSNRGTMGIDCKQPDFIYTPALMDHVAKGMKINRRVKRKTSAALKDGKFELTSASKHNLYDININIAAIVYSNQYNTRIGEVAVPLTALFYENCIDQMIIVDDTQHDKSTALWEAQILFEDKAPSEQLTISDLEEVIQQRYIEWDTIDAIKGNKKHLLRTANIGIWKGFETGSLLSYIPLIPETETEKEKEVKKEVSLLLLLDTKHQLPFNDEWLSNALALFEQYPNLQVLGGFSGVIKSGTTFGDVNVGDMRSEHMDKEAKVFAIARETKYHQQMTNKRRYEEYRVNIVELIDKYKDEYFDKYWNTFWKKAKRKHATNHDNAFNDNDEDTDTDTDTDNDEAVGLFSMNFLNDFDRAVFLNEDDPHYNQDKVQTGLEAIQHVIKKRFLEKYELEIEKRLPISAKILKKIRDERLFCRNNKHKTPAEKEECDKLLAAGGKTTFDYHYIPYEQRINAWNIDTNEAVTRWIPFMFVTSVRMGPIFIRREWWFDKLLPHLTQVDNMQSNDKHRDWFDIELSLYTWAAGGYVGLYDADEFKFDRADFVAGLNRNQHSDEEWHTFQQTKSDHVIFKDWDVWNITHLVQLNEENANNELRLRTSMADTSANPAHPTAIENSRQIMMTMFELEKLYHDGAHDHQATKHNLIRLQKQTDIDVVNDVNPFN